MLRPFAHPVACCCAKFETGQTFQPTTPNIVSATMLDPFAQLFQHCWGHARSLRMVYKDLWVVSFPRRTAGPNIVGSCCIRLHTTANTHATTSNIVGATMLGVVAFARSLTCEKSCTQTWPPIHCSVHKYGRRDVMSKQEIRKLSNFNFQWTKTFIVPE